MESKVKDNGLLKVVNTVQADKTPRFVAGNPVNVVAKANEQKQEASGASAPLTNEVKQEIRAKLAEEKPVLNLELTLKKIKELARLSNQRDKLIKTIDELEAFEVNQLDDAEETNLNHFQRCELKITDDNGHTFSTKNPFIIDQVAKSIAGLCTGKLMEVEGQISLNL